MKSKISQLYIHLMKIVENTSIDVLVVIILLFSLVFSFGFGYLGMTLLGENSSEWFINLNLFLTGIIASLGGVVQIIKKQSPRIPGKPFRGKIAIVIGVIWITLMIFLSLISLVSLIQGIE